METAHCKSCGAEIEWCRTEATGKRMPINPWPVGDGNVVMVANTLAGEMVVRVLRKAEEWIGLRYKSHFATCPNGPSHRKDR